MKPHYINELLVNKNTAQLKQGTKLYNLILRPQLRIFDLIDTVRGLKKLYERLPADRRDEIMESAEILIKYSGYIEREKEIANKLNRLENINITGKFEYLSLASLSTEARQKLDKIQPETIGQASRISGVSPSDINVLLVLLGR